MFLFRKKKDNTEASPGAEKNRIKSPEVSPVAVEDNGVKVASGVKTVKAVPVRVVVPNTHLKKDTPGQRTPTATGEISKLQNPEEIADSLLVKVEPNPAIKKPVDEAVVAAVLKPVIEINNNQTVVPSPVTGSISSKAGGSPPALDNPAIMSPVSNVSQAATSPASVTNMETVKDETEGLAQSQKDKTAGQSPPSAPADLARTVQSAKPPDNKETKPAEGEKKENKADDKGNMFSSLFGKTEVDEETPLDRLIKSLPDVSIEEVANEADEVKNLMNEWMQSQQV